MLGRLWKLHFYYFRFTSILCDWPFACTVQSTNTARLFKILEPLSAFQHLMHVFYHPTVMVDMKELKIFGREWRWQTTGSCHGQVPRPVVNALYSKWLFDSYVHLVLEKIVRLVPRDTFVIFVFHFILKKLCYSVLGKSSLFISCSPAPFQLSACRVSPWLR